MSTVPQAQKMQVSTNSCVRASIRAEQNFHSAEMNGNLLPPVSLTLAHSSSFCLSQLLSVNLSRMGRLKEPRITLGPKLRD